MDILSSRIILRPTDYERTLAFYRDSLGLAIAREYPGGTVFFAGQSLIEVAAHGGSGRPSQFDGAIWLQVRDVSDAAAELALKGVALDRAPVQEPWGLIEMWVRDPDGVPIVLVEIPPDHPIRRDTRRSAG
ncbi:catechol 2,3-dioxygenase-like lactoylglutathione lyase family enzyme [Nocardia tenerifensis]|uniref:Catechol 2,3-dioxygenase-like lactoylglutathione lyase family enzyme n=1 Tax=Nocardia tenerifensis TaxID=228006 RepID=A0A318KPY0_9NOCA|nr:VOC family protein [Nocardia tenerifensis]PXX64977.1 catechol 2,3-dioxygenase-like lactoylglutathione lyase family enzyme [Nocardia tenerifensis]